MQSLPSHADAQVFLLIEKARSKCPHMQKLPIVRNTPSCTTGILLWNNFRRGRWRCGSRPVILRMKRTSWSLISCLKWRTPSSPILDSPPKTHTNCLAFQRGAAWTTRTYRRSWRHPQILRNARWIKITLSLTRTCIPPLRKFQIGVRNKILPVSTREPLSMPSCKRTRFAHRLSRFSL